MDRVNHQFYLIAVATHTHRLPIGPEHFRQEVAA